MPQKHKMKEHDAKDIVLPVFIPNEEKELNLEVGTASMKGGQIVIKFNTKLPAQAIQGMIARKELMCLTLVPAYSVIEIDPETKRPVAEELVTEEETTS